MQRARDIMTANPHCSLPESSVHEAAEVMKNENCGIIPVINHEGQCVGVVTDRDLCIRVIVNRLNPDQTMLYEVMTHNPVICHPEDRMEDVVRKMEARKVRRILVVDDTSKCIGIISEADVAMKEEDKSLVCELVAAVAH